MKERLEQANGVERGVQTFGCRADPTVAASIHGACASMLWWPDGRLCHLLADRGLHVVRFDCRETGHDLPPVRLRDRCGGPHDDTLASLSSLTMSSTRSRASPKSIWLFSR